MFKPQASYDGEGHLTQCRLRQGESESDLREILAFLSVMGHAFQTQTVSRDDLWSAMFGFYCIDVSRKTFLTQLQYKYSLGLSEPNSIVKATVYIYI